MEGGKIKVKVNFTGVSACCFIVMGESIENHIAQKVSLSTAT